MTNIATGNEEQTQSILNRQGIPALKNVLKGPNTQSHQQAIWVLSNMASENVLARDAILAADVLPLVVSNITPAAPHSLLKACMFCIINLCRGKPEPKFGSILPALKGVTQVLMLDDSDLTADAATALYFISDGGGPRIAYTLATGVVPRLVKLLGHSKSRVASTCLRIVGSVTTGSDEETQVVVEAGGIEPLMAGMQSPDPNYRKEACWVVSNIAAGTVLQTAQLLNAGILPLVCKILKDDEDSVRVEAMWIATNVTTKMEAASVQLVAESGLISLLPVLLRTEDTKMLVIVLQFVLNVLQHAKKHYGDKNAVAAHIEQIGCLDILEGLQYHANQMVYKFVSKILEEHFIDDCIEEEFANDSNAAGAVSIFNF